MTPRRLRPVGPVLHTGGPQGILSFYEGQTLEHGQSGALVIVLKVWDEGQKALLFSLDNSDRPPFEANAAWAVAWDDAYLDGPRLVELYKSGEEKPLWAAYLPHFSAACDLWKHYANQEGERFSLVIHCQNNDEYEHLEATGYFKFSAED
jgi:hypothetical protein